MTRYTVTWLEEAQDELAKIWTTAKERRQVTEAANAIDLELLYDAETKGQPLSEGLRSLSIPPLHVLFSVKVSDRLVEVSLVRIDPGLPQIWKVTDSNRSPRHDLPRQRRHQFPEA